MDFNSNHMNNQNHAGGGSYQPYTNPYTRPDRQPGSGLCTAAMILGILSIVTACMMTVYLPFIFGGLAIILALLSKGCRKLQGKAVAGIACAAAGLLLNLAVLTFAVRTVIADPELMLHTAKVYDTMIEQMYGVPSEEIFGESMEDSVSEMYRIFK